VSVRYVSPLFEEYGAFAGTNLQIQNDPQPIRSKVAFGHGRMRRTGDL